MDQDAAWKRFFGHPVVVRHLLRGFAGEVVDLLDLDTLQQLPASWVAADGEQRRGPGDICCLTPTAAHKTMPPRAKSLPRPCG